MQTNKSILNRYQNHFPFITNGFVMDTDDPNQMGRMKVWCPALDGESYNISQLPWAEYAAPFGGVTNDFPAGRNRKAPKGPVPYGFYCLPKLNSQVLVFLLNGNPNRRFFFAAAYDLHRNRGLPSGRNKKPDETTVGPFTDSYDPLEPAYSNLRAAFNGDVSNPIAQTRGVSERQVAQPKLHPDGNEGYAPAAADPTEYLDPQTYCWVTPGHHVITMNDTADNCRIRVKTCEGNQIILDDTNERIYISTASGNTWVELDEDGHIHMYGAKSISVRAEEDINLAAGRNINLEAKTGINIKSEADTRVQGGNVHIKAGATLAATGCTLDLVGTKTRLTGDTVDIKSLGLFAMQGSKITAAVETTPTDADKDERILPGGPAAAGECAQEASGASIVPSHEPFVRPANKNRNSHYKG
jgi:hypothetical protein